MDDLKSSYRLERMLVGTRRDTIETLLKRLEAETLAGKVVTAYDPVNKRFLKVTGVGKAQDVRRTG